uniref:J domain-containing protein n=1 Tax=Alexandrium monilatum TaxID=311494 RepID=A0A7S4VC71_9DINO
MSADGRPVGAAPTSQETSAGGGVASQLLDKIEVEAANTRRSGRRASAAQEASVPDTSLDSVDGEDHYAALQVPPEASDADIRRAYRRLALETHPDKPTGDQVRFLAVARAYTTLTEPRQREAYDAERRRSRQEHRPARLRPPPRVRLRPGREALREVAGDLAAAALAAAEAFAWLQKAVSSQLPAPSYEETASCGMAKGDDAEKSDVGVRFQGEGASCAVAGPPQPPRSAPPPAGPSGQDFL